MHQSVIGDKSSPLEDSPMSFASARCPFKTATTLHFVAPIIIIFDQNLSKTYMPEKCTVILGKRALTKSRGYKKISSNLQVLP